MKHITPSTVLSFVGITAVSIIANYSIFLNFKDTTDQRTAFISIAITQAILMVIVYLISFQYIKSRLHRITEAIKKKDLSYLHSIAEHADESSELSHQLEELIVEESVDKVHLELDDKICLQNTATGKVTLNEILKTVAIKTESLSENGHCSIFLLDNKHEKLFNAASPSVPESYIKAIDGSPIGPNMASCQKTAFTGEVQFVPNIQECPTWQNLLKTCALTSYKSSWSYPLKNAQQEVIGTFTIYYTETKEHCPLDEQIVKASAEMTSLLIQRFNKNLAT